VLHKNAHMLPIPICKTIFSVLFITDIVLTEKFPTLLRNDSTSENAILFCMILGATRTLQSSKTPCITNLEYCLDYWSDHLNQINCNETVQCKKRHRR